LLLVGDLVDSTPPRLAKSLISGIILPGAYPSMKRMTAEMLVMIVSLVAVNYGKAKEISFVE
jgi:hypothetical protein